MSRLLAITVTALMAAAAAGPLAAQDQVAVKVENAQRVYHPRNLSDGKVVKKVKPALVDSKAVFDATPEYKRIEQENIRKDSAEYGLLISQASTRFKNAIKRTMSKGGYDLIAETGAVTVAGKTLPDITQEVIDNLN